MSLEQQLTSPPADKCMRCRKPVDARMEPGALADNEHGHVYCSLDGSAYVLASGEIYCADCARTVVFCVECGCTVTEAERRGMRQAARGVCDHCDVERRFF